MKKTAQLFLTLALLLGMGLSSPRLILAQGPQEWETRSPGCIFNTADGGQVATIQGFECVIANVLSVAISGIGLIGFVMFIYAAFKYLTAGTNTKNVEDARKAMTYSIMGLVIALTAYFIVRLIANFTGISALTTFRIPNSTINW